MPDTIIQNGEKNMNDKAEVVLYVRKEDCCGCTACYAVCERGAISMIEDEEGFAYPRVNYEKCIRCCKCLKVCPIKNKRDSY